jgi:hypothetical protein
MSRIRLPSNNSSNRLISRCFIVPNAWQATGALIADHEPAKPVELKSFYGFIFA